MPLYRDHVLPRCIDWVMRGREFSALRQRVLSPLRGTVLEIGFGSGLNLPWLPDGVEQLLALDPATLGRRLARRRLAACPVPVTFVELAEGGRYALPDASVDAVVSTWTLCSIADLGRALAEVRRVLRPGGRLHFLEHGLCPDPRVARWQRRLDPLQRRLAGGCTLTLPVAQRLREAGFALERLDAFFMDRGPRFAGWLSEGVAVDPVSGSAPPRPPAGSAGR